MWRCPAHWHQRQILVGIDTDCWAYIPLNAEVLGVRAQSRPSVQQRMVKKNPIQECIGTLTVWNKYVRGTILTKMYQYLLLGTNLPFYRPAEKWAAEESGLADIDITRNRSILMQAIESARAAAEVCACACVFACVLGEWAKMCTCRATWPGNVQR